MASGVRAGKIKWHPAAGLTAEILRIYSGNTKELLRKLRQLLWERIPADEIKWHPACPAYQIKWHPPIR